MNKKNFSDESRSLVESELERILNSRQFSSAPAVRVFLKFVVDEVIAGRGDRIKAFTIATEAFGRNSQFDPSSDTIVRTTAGRVRKALEAYYRECDTDSRVIISLPKGGYLPSFEIQNSHSSSRSIPPKFLSQIHQGIFRSSVRITTLLFVLLATGFATVFWWENQQKLQPINVVIDVLPVKYFDQNTQAIAREIDIRLSPALSHIGLAKIFPPNTLPSTNKGEDTTKNPVINRVAFTLKANVTNAENPEFRWQLIDSASGHLLWAAKEQLSGTNAAAIENAVGDVSFQVLGEGGAVPLALARYHGETFSKQICLSRAQLIRAVENADVYPEMRECLERVVTRFPNDASAWAILSTFYTVRTRYYTAGGPEKLAELIELSERAAAEAEALAPEAYLTKVALMHLALRQHRVAEFNELQRQIRQDYSGDIFLMLRIASRIARLGRGWEALEIYNQTRDDWGMALRSRSADIALAYFVEGEYESAHHQISRTTSSQLYVLTLKAAILGKLGMVEEAQPVIDELVAGNPNIKETIYPWFTELSWAEPLVLDIIDGLAKAGLVVSVLS